MLITRDQIEPGRHGHHSAAIHERLEYGVKQTNGQRANFNRIASRSYTWLRGDCHHRYGHQVPSHGPFRHRGMNKVIFASLVKT